VDLGNHSQAHHDRAAKAVRDRADVFKALGHNAVADHDLAVVEAVDDAVVVVVEDHAARAIDLSDVQANQPARAIAWKLPLKQKKQKYRQYSQANYVSFSSAA
jgi:hypothetical protein